MFGAITPRQGLYTRSADHTPTGPPSSTCPNGEAYHCSLGSNHIYRSTLYGAKNKAGIIPIQFPCKTFDKIIQWIISPIGSQSLIICDECIYAGFHNCIGDIFAGKPCSHVKSFSHKKQTLFGSRPPQFTAK